MLTSSFFGEPKILQYFIEHLSEISSWLYIDSDISEVTIDTICYPRAMGTKEMSETETLEFEAYTRHNGLKCFLCRDDLEDIEDNLSQQVSDFTPQELITAINFYWKNDAFINL